MKKKLLEAIQCDMAPYVNELEFEISAEKKNNRIEIRKKAMLLPDKEQIHILRFDFDWNTNIKNLAEKCKYNDAVVVAFDVPWISWYLKKKSTEDLVKKGVAEVKRLLDKGIPSKNIVLDGLCITSAVATKVAKTLFDEGIVVNVFNDRSFSTIDTFFQSRKMESMGKTKEDKKVFSFKDKLFIKLLGMKMDVEDSFRELYLKNPDRINYIVFRPLKDNDGKREVDKIISHNISIHKAIKDLRVAAKKPIKEAIDLIIKYKQKESLEDEILHKDELILQLNSKLKEYMTINQETTIKDLNINLFKRVITTIQQCNDCDAALYDLKRICFVINSNHKVEMLYSEEEMKQDKFKKVFEKHYDRHFKDTTESQKKEIFDTVKNNKEYLKKIFKKDYVRPGHTTGRHYLYSRLYHNTVEPNLNIRQDSVKPWIKEKYEENINGEDSLFGDFIKSVKLLNERGRAREMDI